MATKKAKKTARSARQRPAPKKAEQFGFLSLAEQVQLAMPLAREYIVEGINIGHRTEEDLIERLAEMSSDADLARFYREAGDHELGMWGTRLEAARAVGIALGLLLRPEVFATDAGPDWFRLPDNVQAAYRRQFAATVREIGGAK